MDGIKFSFGFRQTMKSLSYLVFIVFSFFCQTIQAEVTNQEIRDLANNVVRRVYDELISKKDLFPELANLESTSLSQDRSGLLSLSFRYDSNTQERYYLIGLTVLDSDQPNPFEPSQNVFEYEFPFLQIKLAGIQIKRLGTKQFDFRSLAEKHSRLFAEKQQEYLPVRLSIEPAKRVFHVGEEIEFYVTLKNISNRKQVIEDLNSETLYFDYNNRKWSAPKEVIVKDFESYQFILKPGKEARKKFTAKSFPFASEFEVFCSYIIKYNNVNPSAYLKINIIDK